MNINATFVSLNKYGQAQFFVSMKDGESFNFCSEALDIMKKRYQGYLPLWQGKTGNYFSMFVDTGKYGLTGKEGSVCALQLEFVEFHHNSNNRIKLRIKTLKVEKTPEEKIVDLLSKN